MPRMTPIEKWAAPHRQIGRRLRRDKMTDAQWRAASRVHYALFALAHNKETLQQNKDALLAAVIEAQILWPERH